MAAFLSAVVPRPSASFLLCLWLNGCWAVWRYRTNTGNYFLFSTRTTIYLEHEGTLFSEWNVPLLCIIGDKTLQKTTLHCSVPGTHRVIPTVTPPATAEAERFFSIIADVNCFMWYVYQDRSRLTQYDPIQSLKLWIFDPENADTSELEYTATSPSVYSKTLSKQFWNLGQTPVINTYGGKEYKEQGFDDGIWTIKVHTLESDNIAEIYGKTFTFQDCFILTTPFVIAQPKYKLGFDMETSISSPPGSLAMPAWDACYPATAVLVTDFGTYYTNDGFITVEEVKFPSSIIDSALVNSVKNVEIVFPDILILIEDKVYKTTEEGIYALGNLYDIPETGIKGIRTKDWCSNEYPLLDRVLSIVLIWTEVEIFVGYPDDHYVQLADTEVLKVQLRFLKSINLLIITACYDSLTSIIAVLIECTGCLASKVFFLAFYNEVTSEWDLRDFSLSSGSVDMHIEVIPSATTSMLLWNDDKVFYTYKENKDYGYLQVSGAKKIFSASSEGSTIHQIIIDYNGNTIIKLKNNVIFFFKFEMHDTVKLAPWLDETAHFVFYSNPSGDMYLLTIDGMDIERQIYPLKLEVFSAAWTLNEICPYISFEHNMNQNVYYIDMGEEVTFWSQLVYQENLGLFTEVEVYRPELLKQEENLHYEIARGICTKNNTIKFYHKADYSLLTNYESSIKAAQGIMTFELHPSRSGKTCSSKIKLAHIRVGCPPEKELQVTGKPSECKNFSFTIPWKSIRNRIVEEDLEINYDIEIYGCPLEVHYAETFRPTVGLYMNNKFMNVVETNYVLWEVNDRNDFAYNSTMDQVLCLKKAQSWGQMFSNYGKNETSSVTFEEREKIWGPHNYVSCFVTHVEDLSDLDNPYEILNHSGLNSIIWPQYSTGIYMFKLEIVDPNFSFCNLSTFFAVRTYGILERPNWLLVAGWSIMIVSLFWGVLVFSYFRYVKTFQKLNFVDPLLKHSSQTSRMETTGHTKND